MSRVAAVVLCGGTSARFGGGDKTAAALAGSTVLGHVVAALPASWAVVCVGEARPLPRAVTWEREEPPGGGPVAGLAAGLRAPGAERADVIVALAGDQPFAGGVAADLVAALAGADGGCDAVAALDGDDRRARPQLLLAAYRRGPLAAAVGDAPAGAGVYRTLAGLRVHAMAVASAAALDVDTVDDLHRAARAAPPTPADPAGRDGGRALN